MLLSTQAVNTNCIHRERDTPLFIKCEEGTFTIKLMKKKIQGLSSYNRGISTGIVNANHVSMTTTEWKEGRPTGGINWMS